MQLSGHTVLITGGASGIGLALAEQFIRLHNEVIIVGRNEQKLQQMKETYPNITTYAYDLGVTEQIDLLVQQLYERHSNLSVLINNAGIQYNYSFMTAQASEQVEEEIAIHLTAPILLISKLLPLLNRRQQAAIVNVTSGLAIAPKQSAPVYCASKAGMHIFSKALRYQLEKTRIQVFEIIPPIVDTEMTKGRGRNKISPQQLAEQFISYYRKDQLVVPIGKVKWLLRINRWLPSLAAAILKNS